MNTDLQMSWWRPAASVSVDAGAGERRRSIAFGALLAFTLVLLLSPQQFIPALAPLHLALLSAVAAGGVYVAGRLLRRQPVLRFTPDTLLAGCLAAWSLATLPFSHWPGGSLSFFLDIYFKALVVFWLLANVVDSVARLKTVAWTLSLVAVPLSVAGVASFFSGGFHSEELSHGLDRISGYGTALTGNPNDLALMLDLILPLSLALLFMTRRAGLRWLLVAVIGLDIVAVIATFSRAGFLVLGVVCVAYLYMLLKRRRRGLAALAVLAALLSVPLLPSAYLDRLSTITNIQADTTNSAQERLGDSIVAAEFVVAHPLVGAGIGMNILALNEIRGARWTEVHDVYLEYAADLGLPGLLLFLLLLYYVLKGVGRARRFAGDHPAAHDLRHLAEGLRVSLVAFMVAGFFYPDAYQFYFYYIAGLAVAARDIAGRLSAAPGTPPVTA